MAIRITRANQFAKNQKIKMLVYGDAGSGKTVLSATAEAPTLILSAEAGLLSLQDAPDYVDATQIETLEDLDEIYDSLLEDEPPYEWISLDSISEIAEVVLAAEKKNFKDPRKAYGEMQDVITSRIRKFRGLNNYHILMTAKLGRIADNDTGLVKYGPNLPGNNLPADIPYFFDEVLSLQIVKDEDGNEERLLQTSDSKSYRAKDRSGRLDFYEEANLASLTAKLVNKPRTKKRKLKKRGLK